MRVSFLARHDIVLPLTAAPAHPNFPRRWTVSQACRAAGASALRLWFMAEASPILPWAAISPRTANGGFGVELSVPPRDRKGLEWRVLAVRHEVGEGRQSTQSRPLA